ncbi:MAG: hypothetical protein CM15mP81_09640 [Alphaproteobacteria bacterium]|nr:MAG: hypothetical protein CM15mP81_09640 [Alphaproteobacteria bacterium]
MILGEMARNLRLIYHSKNKNEGMYFKSSGTTVGTIGPVDVFRSNITLSLSRLTNGNLIDWSVGKKIDTGECLFHMAPEMTDFLAFAAIGSDFLDTGSKCKFWSQS